METETQVLEINLISAQGLKTPSANLRRMQTYALAWVNPSAKLRTLTDHVGGQNPTWNEKFMYRVSPDFILSDTSAVSVEIYAVGCIKDYLVGTVRFLLSSCLSSGSGTGNPSFTAVQIRRPSGRFHGILNIAATVYNGSDLALMSTLPAVCFRDLIGENRRWGLPRRGSKKSQQSSGGESCGESVDLSDGGDSTASSSSSSNTPNVLKEWNGNGSGSGVNNVAGKKGLESDGVGMLCGLMLQRKICLGPLDENCGIFAAAQKKH